MNANRFISALATLLTATCLFAAVPAQDKAKTDGGKDVKEDHFRLIEGEPRLLILKEPPFRITLEDNIVADYNMVSKTQITLVGRKGGDTTMVIHVGDPAKGNVGRLELKIRVLPTAKGVPAEPARSKNFQQHVQRVVDPEKTIDLKAMGLHVMKFKEAPIRVQLSDPKVLTYEFANPTQMEMRGLRAGIAILNIWLPDKKEKIGEKVLSLRIQVAP